MQHGFTTKFLHFRAIFYCVLLPVCLASCRASRDTRINEVSSVQSETENHTQTIKENQSSTEEKSRITGERYFIETSIVASFDSLGKLCGIQATRRETGLRQVEDKGRRQVDVSVTAQKTDSSAVLSSGNKKNMEETNNSDSRPVQGIEWLWMALPVVLIASLAYFFRRKIPT